MTLDELFSRVIRSHLVLIGVIALVPVALVLALGLMQPTDHRASVRIQTTSVVPTSSTEAEALSSRVLAIATTPNVVDRALTAAGMSGDPVLVSEEHVAAQRLGESPVVELTVTESDPDQAKALVSALSTRVLRFMNTADRGRFETAVDDVDRRLADIRAQRDRLADRLRATPPGTARDRLEDLATQAGQVASELTSQRASLVMADVTRGRAVLVDDKSPTVVRVPSPLAPRAGLALILGLCLGIATASAIETLRPKVPDARGLARVLDTPVLATTKQASASLVRTLSLVARRHGLDTVVIVPADSGHQGSASSLVSTLSRMTRERERLLDRVGHDVSYVGSGHVPTGEAPTSFVSLSDVRPDQELSAGVAVVCAGPVRHENLEELHDVLRATRWPLIGVLDAGRTWTAARADAQPAGGEEL